mmetsp:Transcript_4845/g.11048  ORF Transcript_4845/g.11048 Transcript_4845/m.11048 type:complete len:210 (+) Transcript_4845:319-948(+)
MVVGKGGDRSRNVVSRNEGHDGNLCKTSVVKLARSLLRHSGFTDTREVNRREDHGRVVSTLHVVSSLVTLSDQLGDEDGGKDLCLSGNRNSRPSIRRGHGGEGFEANVTGEHAGEVESSGVEEVSGGGNHGNAAMLELGATHPEEGLITSDVGEVEGIEVGEGGRGAADVIKAKGELGAHGLGGDRGERSGGADEGKADSSGLHLGGGW